MQYVAKSQVKIGDNPSDIDSASLLELESTDKGFVLPRVSLQSLISSLPLSRKILVGTLVFNTNPFIGPDGPGVYLWRGGGWGLVTSQNLSIGPWETAGNTGLSSTANWIGNGDSVDFVIRTDNIERMRVLASGDVGIGTKTPAEKLSVNGKFYLDSAFMPGGNGGLPGQVLTSTGPNTAPTWQGGVGNSNKGWLLTGNDTTTATTNSFLGTVAGTAVPLLFKAQGDTVGYLGLKDSTNSVSFGVGASGANTATSSVAIGAGAQATAGNEAVALGSNAVAGSFQDIAIGANAQTATSSANIAIGSGAQATSSNAIAIGSNAQATTSQIALALGVSAQATGAISMAIGNGARSTNTSTTAYGALALASGTSANAFGNRSNASGDSSLAVGNNSKAQGLNSVVIGNNSSASGLFSTIFGSHSSSTGDSTTIIGNNLTTTASNVLILGNASKKIGMGTTNPQEKLDVVGNVRFSSALMPNGSAGTAGQILISGGVNTPPTWVSSTVVTPAWLVSGNSGTNSGDNFLGTVDNVSLRVRTNNTERMVIDSTGNVGIGTGNPTNALTVQATNPLFLSGVQPITSLGSGDSILTISNGVVKKVVPDIVTNGFTLNKYYLSINIPLINNSKEVSIDVTVPNTPYSANGSNPVVTVNPDVDLASGLIIGWTRVVANNTVRIHFNNVNNSTVTAQTIQIDLTVIQ
jgi:hypothetical protein